MALGHSPSIVTSGLVMCVDAANYKSFKGTPATNISNTITFQQSNQNGALYKVTNGTETVYIPSLGYVSSKYVDFYNDYGGGSGVCCPNLFSYGTGLAVSPNTTYTYSIIYKTTTGYSHPNYMYRYEYNSSGGFMGEAGVHSTGNRTSLGDDWWFAWGQFTTSATTATLNTFLFHYEYATQNRVYVYKAALYQGTYVIRPEHMLSSSENRGSTVATSGGWADIIGNGNHGTLTNGPTYSSDNGGSIVFDGTDDLVINGVGNDYPYPYHTLDVWVKSPSLSPTMNGGGGLIAFDYGRILMINSVGGIYYVMHDGSNVLFSSNINENLIFNNTWHNVVALRGEFTYQVYVDGILKDSGSNGGNSGWNGLNVWSAMSSRIGDNPNDNRYKLLGNIASVKVYNRALTAAEISQNFNALRGRFGI